MKKIGTLMLTSLLLSLGMSFSSYAMEYPQKDVIPDGIYLEEMPLGGMTAAEAQEQLESRIAEAEEKKVIINYSVSSPEYGNRTEVALIDLGLKCEDPNVLSGVSEFGHHGNMIERYKELKDLEQNPVVYTLDYTWSTPAIMEYVSAVAPSFRSEPVNAEITKNGSSFSVTESKTGWHVNMDSTTAKVFQALTTWDEMSDITVDATMVEDQPERSKEALSAIGDKLGEQTTAYSGDDTLGRNKNLILGASLINGSVVMPGETFSANAAMEPYTEELGWDYGGSYTADGQVEQTLGGGICQISSTFYNAALYSEVTIAQRQNHSMSVGYLPLGLDAAIAGYWKDLKIRNDFEYPIYIESYAKDGTLYFAVWGKETRPAERRIVFESITLESWDEDPVYEDDPTLPAGTEEESYGGHTGYRSIVYKHVYMGDTEVETTVLSEDSYKASPKIIRRGTGAAPAAEPAE